MNKILKVEKVKFQEHDETRLKYLRRVETTLIEDGTFEYLGKPLTTSEQVYRIFKSIGRKDREVAIVLFLDKAAMPIGYDVWSGGIDFVSIDPRQIFKVASMLNASHIFICHNHPEGDPRPSQGDEMFCLQICNLCYVMGWVLVDFLVIVPEKYYSFREAKNPSLLTPPSAQTEIKGTIKWFEEMEKIVTQLKPLMKKV